MLSVLPSLGSGIIAKIADLVTRSFLGYRHRRQVLQTLQSDVVADRDAFNTFFTRTQLGVDSGHLLGNPDIWYSHLLATTELPVLRTERDADDVAHLRHAFSKEHDLDLALRDLLRLHGQLPRLQNALREKFEQGEGHDIWRDYTAWEAAKMRHDQVLAVNPEETMKFWEQQQDLERRWYQFKSRPEFRQCQEAFMRGMVQTRDQCEVIMRMVWAELPKPSLLVHGDTRGLL